MSDRPLIVIGSGDHAAVLVEALRLANRKVLFATDVSTAQHGRSILGVEIKGSDDLITSFGTEEIELVNGIGSVDVPRLRAQVFADWISRGYQFASVIHPRAILGSELRLGQGVLVLAGAILQYGVELGDNVLVNTGAQLDHRCKVDDHSQIAPAVTLCGNVRIGSKCHIGAGATVIQGIQIGDDSVIGAGSVVIRDVPNGSRCAGVPACSIVRMADVWDTNPLTSKE